MPVVAIVGTAIAAVLSVASAWVKIRMSDSRKRSVTVTVGEHTYVVSEKAAETLIQQGQRADAR
jgi:hypothetical protein